MSLCSAQKRAPKIRRKKRAPRGEVTFIGSILHLSVIYSKTRDVSTDVEIIRVSNHMRTLLFVFNSAIDMSQFLIFV
jgi:hypothetical protein